MVIHAGSPAHDELLSIAHVLNVHYLDFADIREAADRLAAIVREIEDPTCETCNLPRSLHDDGECPLF